MKLRFDESKIQDWANQYGPQSMETQFEKLKPRVQKRGYLTKNELGTVARWKSPRRAGLTERNDDNYIRDLTSCAFTAKSERTRVRVLTCLDGVALPTASTILHFFHKDRYPILDFRAVWSIGVENYNYSFSFWWEYVSFCRDLADRNDVDMRTLDRALWQYSKQNQK